MVGNTYLLAAVRTFFIRMWVEVKWMGDEQRIAPILTGLTGYAQQGHLPFHVPGHKGGLGMDAEFRALVGAEMLALDVTNIAPLDDLHQPRAMIKSAQRLAAQAFGADRTWFSVQGTTTPIMAMLMAVCGPGEEIILPRNIHRSVLSGLIFSGAKPVFLAPPMDARLGINHCLRAEQVEQALIQYPASKGVFVINPTYYGFAGDLARIVRSCHARDVPVLVDEAHGSHFYFHPGLPPSAMEAEADLAAVSVHKLGGSLTQSSLLNQRGNRVSPQRIQTMLNSLTTTSASFLLLASLDTARRHLALNGKKIFGRAMDLADLARRGINEIPGLWCPGAELVEKGGTIAGVDVTKLVISVRQLGISGRKAERWLSHNRRVEVELGDLHNVLCIITEGDNRETVSGLLAALRALSAEFRPGRKRSQGTPLPGLPVTPRLVLTPREAFYAPKRCVKLKDAVGEVAAEWLMTYPPGIPLILPGEVVDRLTYESIRACQEAGLTMLGLEDTSLQRMWVVSNA